MKLIESGHNIRGHQRTPEDPVLLISDIHKSFDFAANNGATATGMLNSIHEVIAGLELGINEGEFVTIVGASGCGKSTLLNIIAGLDRPDSGSVIVRGSNNISSIKRIMIFQEGALFPWLSVRENVEFGLKIANIQRDQRRQIADRYIELVHSIRHSQH
jgi:ABC-type nitrate/sulfonate/bicarbonate transport system ATPase subunit